MVWTAETSCGYESAKIASLAVPYLQGLAVDCGCGLQKVWPDLIGIDNGHHWGRGAANIMGDCRDLSFFADEALDAVFSSHTLEHFPRDQVPLVLASWARALKIGGYLVLYLPSGNLYPRMGTEGANPDHKWDPLPGDIEAMLRDMAETDGPGWRLIHSEERNGTNEYSLFIVAQKIESGYVVDLWQRKPEGRDRCLVIRYGAIGDQIIASSVLPHLKAEGYHITYQTTPEASEVLKHNPHIDEWWLQAKDFVPNQELGPYWQSIAERFDRVINLCESIEGALLAMPGRREHMWPPEVRDRMIGRVNYLEYTHDFAGVPRRFRPQFHATQFETDQALIARRRMNGPVVLWALDGSSVHKIYTQTHIVCAWLLERTPAHVVLTTGPGGGMEIQRIMMEKMTEHGCDMRRMHPRGGIWSIREALAFAQIADCVVGPETGVLNAVSFDAMPKVIYLSHSSPENLTKHWINTYSIMPTKQECPCYPCHMLHHGWEHCHQDPETQMALCAAAIHPTTLFSTIAKALVRQEERARCAAD